MDFVVKLRTSRPTQERSALLFMSVLTSVVLLSVTGGYAAEGRLANKGRLLKSSPIPERVQPESRQMTEKELEAAMDKRVRTLKRGTSQRSARKAALAVLPLNQMSKANREKAEGVIKSLSLFRELPTLSVEVNPHIYRFFVQNPDVAVSIWRVMQISQFEMWQTDVNEYEADAKDGTVGVIDVLHRGENNNVIYCEGEYKSPLLRKAIQAKTVLHLQSSFSKDRTGKEFATHRLYMYVSFPSQSIGTAAKVMSPVSNMIVDRNFKEISLFLNMMTLAMTRQPSWVETVATRMEGVVTKRKAQLLKLTEEVHQEHLMAARLGRGQTNLGGSRKVIQTAGRPDSN